jgi:hypothetical protein
MPDFARGRRGAEMIHFAYASSRQPIIVDALRRIFNETRPTEIIIIGTTGVCHGGIVTRSGTTVRIFLAGVYHASTRIAMLQGYTAVGYPVNRPTWNVGVKTTGEWYWREVLQNLVRQNDTVELYGHSAGGCVCEFLATILQAQQRGADLAIDTYGSPCPGTASACIPETRIDRQRWMRFDDPVPLVPFAEMPRSIFIAAFLAQFLVGGVEDIVPHPEIFRQPGAGFRIQGDAWSIGWVPIIDGSPIQKVQDWVSGDLAPGTAHDNDVYALTLRHLQQRFGENTNELPSTAPPRQPRPVEINLVMPFVLPYRVSPNDTVTVAIGPNGEVVDSAYRPIGTATIGEPPMSFVKINPKKAFRQVRVGRQWQISIGERVVAVADIPKRPRTLCKRLNGMLRAIGTDNTIYLAELMAGLQEWMTAAAGDEEYSRPTIRVDL